MKRRPKQKQRGLFDDFEFKKRIDETGPDFDGAAYDKKADKKRLTGQILRVYNLMKDGHYRTHREIHEQTGDPEASISAQLRHLRKEKFGSHTVDKRHRGEKKRGLWEYALILDR